ncbi:MAG TPA: phosphatase PAP2 family protein [Opitutaceae bacterium]|nr:phosphatase PAP2 family protein [Opitutaceae bacterium]
MRLLRLLLPAAAAVLAAAGAFAATNPVLYWNEQALNAIRLARTPPPIASLHLATFHAAIHDAVNGLAPTHRGWLPAPIAAPVGADVDAAIAGAAHTVLLTLWGQAANPQNFRAAFDAALADLPDSPAKADGILYGRRVAEAVMAARAKSGAGQPAAGVFTSSEPGRWRETPPGFRPAVLPGHAKVTPFVMTSPDQFRAPPPPPVDSKEHAEEIAYVARFGARDGSERTEYQTLTAPFWADDLGSATPPGHWNVIAQDLARRNRLGTAESARLFALLNFACADGGISCWDTKFHYRSWRPETAIREVTLAVNAHAKPVPDFIPLMSSPAFPGYTSGHSTFSAAASRILELWFGTDDIEFTTTSDGLPGAVRTYRKLSEARAEVGMSRVWAGIHFMSDNLAGQAAGLQIADFVFANALQPLGAAPAGARGR